MADSLGANVIVSGLQKDERYRLPLVESLGIETVTTDETDLAGLVETSTDGIGFDVVFNTSYGFVWRDFEQALRLMERDDIPLEEIIDDSFGIDDPAAAFEAFLDAETLKPVFRFGD